jgi:flagellar biosynthesis activator protein FlaF
MFAVQMEAYQKVQKSCSTAREVEAAVLTKAALKLKTCQANWSAIDRDQVLREALGFNQQIWNIFQGELLKSENPLPRQVREDILNLSAFIDKRALEVMAFPAPEKLTALIDINLNLAAGLRGSPR